MKHENGFNSFYTEIINKYEDTFKYNQTKAGRNLVLFFVISAIMVLTGYELYNITKLEFIFFAFAIAAILILFPAAVKNSNVNVPLSKEIEQILWNKLFKDYSKGEHLSKDSVKSDLVKTNYLILEQDPYIRTINDKLVECKTIEEYSTDADGDRYTSFHGFMITITGIENKCKCIYKYKHNFYEEKTLNKVSTEVLNKYKTYTNDSLNNELVNKLYELEKNDLLKADIYTDKKKIVIFVSTMDTNIRGSLKRKQLEKAYKKIFYINELIEFICK